ncbi:LysR substrate-binding domain-containing protein [Stappia sp.]|jgi:DNA-binding transcriptional LysR family regulator|uniref:LysR substrate-binding domain-containing protein n=1 Tax=Stappia sp. TaxID=1870903 RepID=UPI003D0E6477
MDRFSEMQAFVAVAERGAFNAAARALNRSPAAVTRLIAGLEARLDARLFLRSTRAIALTEAGERFLVEARQVLAALAEAEETARGAHGTPRGTLRITAPVLFGEMLLAPVLRDFLDANREVAAELMLLDRIVDLVEEGFDIALRIGELQGASLMARRVGTLRLVTVAAPAYLAHAGTPETPDALRKHRLVAARGLGDGDWTFRNGERSIVHARAPALSVNTVRAAIDAAVAGFGVTRALSYQVQPALARGSLVEILAPFETSRIPVHLVHPHGRRVPARVRAFLAFAASALGQRAAPGNRPFP